MSDRISFSLFNTSDWMLLGHSEYMFLPFLLAGVSGDWTDCTVVNRCWASNFFLFCLSVSLAQAMLISQGAARHLLLFVAGTAGDRS